MDGQDRSAESYLSECLCVYWHRFSGDIATKASLVSKVQQVGERFPTGRQGEQGEQGDQQKPLGAVEIILCWVRWIFLLSTCTEDSGVSKTRYLLLGQFVL